MQARALSSASSTGVRTSARRRQQSVSAGRAVRILCAAKRKSVAASAAGTGSSSKKPIAQAPTLDANTVVLQALQAQGHSEQESRSLVQELLTASHGGSNNIVSAAGGKRKLTKQARQGLAMATQLVHMHTSVNDPYGSSGAPLWQTATFAHPSATLQGPYDYTRGGNPTRTMLEEQMAALEGAERSFAFTSGMAALSVVCRLVPAGGHIVAGEDIYGGTARLLDQVLPLAGVSASNVDMTDVEAVKRAIVPGKTKLVHIESPTNPRMQICDIQAVCRAAHAAGALVSVDNSIMAPVLQRPLELGADMCVTSGTKFIGGHGDVTLGILSVKGQELAKHVSFLQNAEGAGLAPFDCWLALRGLKTMALRVERASHNALRIARYLDAHPLVKKVNYAGLPTHPGHAVHMRQAKHGGSLLSFETGSLEASKIVVEQTQLFKVTVSFGNVTSLISLPCFTSSFNAIPPEVRHARGLPDDLVRIATGIEDVDDLIADLDQALALAMKAIDFDPASPTPGVGKPRPVAAAATATPQLPVPANRSGEKALAGAGSR